MTAKLICAFVFAHAKCLFSLDAAHISLDQEVDENGHTDQHFDEEILERK